MKTVAVPFLLAAGVTRALQLNAAVNLQNENTDSDDRIPTELTEEIVDSEKNLQRKPSSEKLLDPEFGGDLDEEIGGVFSEDLSADQETAGLRHRGPAKLTAAETLEKYGKVTPGDVIPPANPATPGFLEQISQQFVPRSPSGRDYKEENKLQHPLWKRVTALQPHIARQCKNEKQLLLTTIAILVGVFLFFLFSFLSDPAAHLTDDSVFYTLDGLDGI